MRIPVRGASGHPPVRLVYTFVTVTSCTTPEGWADYVSAVERLARSSRSQDGIDAEMLGLIGMSAALVWSLVARQRTDSDEEARTETLRFAHELKRLFLFGALRPESWPEFVAEIERENDERGAPT